MHKVRFRGVLGWVLLSIKPKKYSFFGKCSAFDVIFFQEQHRQEVGEQVYPLVEKLAGSEAGLVTGMLLTLDITIVEEAVQEPEV